MVRRIAIAKIAWAETYTGEMPIGRHANIQTHHEAHERFNFLKGAGGKFFGYLPPLGQKKSAPKPNEKDDWLIIFVAAKFGNGPLVVVGWYEDATIFPEYRERPEYGQNSAFPLDADGDPYSYCLIAKCAHLVPNGTRSFRVPGDHLRRTSIVYLRGGKASAPWRQRLARKMEVFVQSRKGTNEQRAPQLQFPNAAHRKRVERAAISAAERYFESSHEVVNREKEKCGYDLLCRHRVTGLELHVEVKGTSAEVEHFYMTRNERNYMTDIRWRLAIVTDTLRHPTVRIFGLKEVTSLFEFEPFAWEASLQI